jgi:hypothetical protein
MTEEALYHKWIEKIAETTPQVEVIQHFIHHAQEAVTEGVTVEWLASAENLLEIIKLQACILNPNFSDKIDRLILHYQKAPERHTPPPIHVDKRKPSTWKGS